MITDNDDSSEQSNKIFDIVSRIIVNDSFSTAPSRSPTSNLHLISRE